MSGIVSNESAHRKIKTATVRITYGMLQNIKWYLWRTPVGLVSIVLVYSPMFMCLLDQDSLRWRHNEHDSVSNHQHRDCFLHRLFRHRSKNTSKLRVTGLCAGNSPEAGEFPAQMANNEENFSIWWRHHGWFYCLNSKRKSQPQSHNKPGFCMFCTYMPERIVTKRQHISLNNVSSITLSISARGW